MFNYYAINPRPHQQAAGDDLLALLPQQPAEIDGQEWFFAKTRSTAGLIIHGVVYASLVTTFTARGVGIDPRLWWTTCCGEMVFVVQLPNPLSVAPKSVTDVFPRAYPGYHLRKLSNSASVSLVPVPTSTDNSPLQAPVMDRVRKALGSLENLADMESKRRAQQDARAPSAKRLRGVPRPANSIIPFPAVPVLPATHLLPHNRSVSALVACPASLEPVLPDVHPPEVCPESPEIAFPVETFDQSYTPITAPFDNYEQDELFATIQSSTTRIPFSDESDRKCKILSESCAYC